MATFEELTEAQRESLAKAAHKLFSNSDVSTKAKKLLMEADKTVRFPELEAQDQIAQQLKQRDERIDELQQQAIRSDAEQARREKRQTAIEAGLDPDEVEKAIVERGITKWETAMDFVRMTQQSAASTPASVHDHRMDLPSNSEGLWKDPTKYARDQAHKMIDEMRNRSRVS